MKKTDIALIIIIVSVSSLVSWWVAGATIGKGNDAPITVRVVDEISTDDVTVDEAVFAKGAINPTVETKISGEDLTSFMDEPAADSDATSQEMNLDSGATTEETPLVDAPNVPSPSGE